MGEGRAWGSVRGKWIHDRLPAAGPGPHQGETSQNTQAGPSATEICNGNHLGYGLGKGSAGHWGSWNSVGRANCCLRWHLKFFLGSHGDNSGDHSLNAFRRQTHEPPCLRVQTDRGPVLRAHQVPMAAWQGVVGPMMGLVSHWALWHQGVAPECLMWRPWTPPIPTPHPWNLKDRVGVGAGGTVLATP